MATTIAQLRTQFDLRKEDTSDVSSTLFVQWCDHLNRELYRYFINSDAGRFISTQNYIVASSPYSEALPTDFRDIAHFGTGLYKIDANGNDTDDFLPITGKGSQRRGYFIEGASVTFTGITNETFEMRYIPLLTQLTSVSDTLSIPDEYIRYMSDGVDRFYEIWDNNPQAEFLADQRYISALDDMLKNYSRGPKIYNIFDANPYY